MHMYHKSRYRARKKYYSDNKGVVDELKAEDSEAALFVANIFKKRGSALKRIEEKIHG